MILKVCADAPYVRLTLPLRCSLKSAHSFIAAQQEWIQQHLTKTLAAKPAPTANELYLWGVPHKVSLSTLPRSSCLVQEGVIHINPRRAQPVNVLNAWLRQQLLLHAEVQAALYAGALRTRFHSIQIKALRARFGSCSSSKKITLNACLIFAGKEMVNYVIAHEVAHLLHMNHSQQYWQTLAGIYPHYQEARHWFRANGDKLLHYSHSLPQLFIGL
jgi:predicted metal-dependent hydrolase